MHQHWTSGLEYGANWQGVTLKLEMPLAGCEDKLASPLHKILFLKLLLVIGALLFMGRLGRALWAARVAAREREGTPLTCLRV